MKERIVEFLRIENKTSSQFAEEIGVQPSSISHIVSGRNNPSLDFVHKMLIRYTSINPDWLLLGKGKMYRGNSEQLDFEPDETSNRGSDQLKSGLFSDLEPSKEVDSSGIDKLPIEPKTGGIIAPNGRRTVKIAIFYNDNSFEEYYPS